MALFGKKKTSKEKKDMKDVKDASSVPPPFPSEPDHSMNTPAAAPAPTPAQTSQDSFVNPFQNNAAAPSSIPTTGSSAAMEPEDLFSSLHTQDLGNGMQAMGLPPTQPIEREDIQEMVDETVEKIIEEKWDKVVNSVEKVISWKDKMEEDLNLMKEDIGNIKMSFEKLEKKLIGKLSDYDRDILDVSSEIKALEKVFQKITPTLVNNINELSKITAEFKANSPSQNKPKP